MSQIQKVTLPNGARILVEPHTHIKSAAVGLWCQTGSRHELEHEAGITHFIEHMLFKGTKTRTAKEIAEAIEGQGGVLNAFTDKEHTCYYCRVLDHQVPHAVDVLADMMINPLLEPEEIQRESKVILEEIKRSNDEPESHVHELHLEARWGEHELGKPIIGTPESVSSFAQDQFRAYMSRRYRAENVILSIAGNVDVDHVISHASAWLSQLESGGQQESLTRPQGKPGHHEIRKDVEQVHFCVGGDGWAIFDEELYAGAVLDAVLGGGMSSRLFQEIRERRGLAYSVGSYSLSYSSGGAFTIYGGTGPDLWPEVQKLIAIEIDRICNETVPEQELNRAKQLLSGNMVLALEGMNSRMMRMSRNELNHKRDIPLEETLEKISAVKAQEVQTLAQRVLDQATLSTTAIVPE